MQLATGSFEILKREIKTQLILGSINKDTLKTNPHPVLENSRGKPANTEVIAVLIYNI